MLGRLTLATLILAASVSGASGLAAMLGDAFVTLPPPAGFCELTPKYEFDGRMDSLISAFLKKAGIRLLVMSADCGQLAEARTGGRTRLDDFALYQTRIAEMEKPPTETIAQMCTNLRTQGDGTVAGGLDARLADAFEKIKTNEASFIGVLAEDQNACYAGILRKFRTEAGAEKRQVEMQAVTIISNRSVSLSRYAVYQDRELINAMLSKLKSDVAALIAANP